ncbi:glycerophosphodiester phosphodiesterase [Halomarina litorea]|uniref:glycerophosphodiester phosphodiesterase n=1 Tax=Halomarina litorea TaxID=2961595 RepID=UPI0020C2DBAD|nr:glycerophosphodiester phosphodiesterase family protein [Halomarina sp. BCD28]
MQRADSTVTSGAPPDSPGDGGFTTIAHRGFAGVFPENTLEAVRGSTTGGSVPSAGMVEIDVMPSAEGVPVVFHDGTLDRVTDADPSRQGQAVWETPLDELRSLDVLDSGQPIPLLEEVVEALPASVALNAELKHPGVDPGPEGLLTQDALKRSRRDWRPFVDRVLALVGASGHDLLVSSFFEGALGAVRDADPDVPLAAVLSDSIEDGFTVARRHDCEAVHVPRNMVPGTPLFDEAYVAGPYEPVDVVARAHREGRLVNVWTIETPEHAAAFAGTAVDGLITDVPLDTMVR